MPRLCVYCKGMHVPEACPLYLKAQAFMAAQKFKESAFSGSAPAPFVGRFGYPEVNVGILAPPEISEGAGIYDAPRNWAAAQFGAPEVVALRASLINSRFKLNINSTNAFLDVAQEVAMAAKPVDIDVALKKPPASWIDFDMHAAPTGPAAELAQVTLASNPHVPTRIQRAVDDTALRAAEAAIDLYQHGVDETRLSRLLSVGTLGLGKNRKLVPTRWSITATDDMLGKALLKRDRDLAVGDCCAYFGGYLGNYYLFLFFARQWSYELFEMSVRQGSGGGWSTDYELFAGRKDYAEETAGGYYTARLAIAEKLAEIKRQSSVLALRFITDEYTLPLGVWVTREAARKALQAKPIIFAEEKLLLAYATHLAKNKFGFDLSRLLPHSKLLKVRQQKTLEGW